MEDLHVFESLIIQSHKGEYSVVFEDIIPQIIPLYPDKTIHFIVDTEVARLYTGPLKDIIRLPSTLLVKAREENKSLDKFVGYVEHFVAHKIRRDHIFIAIGGGIIQDITCFLASTLLRGIEWQFYPTTLLAQADSCIGSKSSINVGNVKNILGTFTPPKKVTICTKFLETLDEKDVRAGVGEMLKVQTIDGPQAFDQIKCDYPKLFKDRKIMEKYIRRSLSIKKRYIEEDEFDTGIRNVFNYGHSFGHAIEAATAFAVPHGIAVSMGSDLANFVAVKLGLLEQKHYDRMHSVLVTNYKGFEDIKIPFTFFLDALTKDKKNVGSRLALILPVDNARVEKTIIENNDQFQQICRNYFAD